MCVFPYPNSVTVAIEEIFWPNGERFTAHPDSGAFHTYLPEVAHYTVRATSASGRTVSRTVRVDSGRALVTLKGDAGAAQ